MNQTCKEIEDNEDIKKEFLVYRDGLVRLEPTVNLLPDISKMKARKKDIWVLSFPKSGTTWTQEMIWQIANKVDLVNGELDLQQRFPFLEFQTLVDFQHIMPGLRGKIINILFGLKNWWTMLQRTNPTSWLGYPNFTDYLESIEEDKPRFIKSHLPFSLLPTNLLDTAKVVYVMRNPKDVVVSYYHHHKLLKTHGYIGSFPSFVRRFMKHEIMMGPYFSHVEEGWAQRNHPNLLLICYEDMKKDLKSVIERASRFLDSTLTQDDIETLLEHLNIKNLRENPAVNMEMMRAAGVIEKEGNFFRKGEVGGSKEEFEQYPDLEKEFEEWIELELLARKLSFDKP